MMDSNSEEFLDGLEYLDDFQKIPVSFTKKDRKGCLHNPTKSFITIPFQVDFSDMVPYLLSLQINQNPCAGDVDFGFDFPLEFFWGTSSGDFDSVSISFGDYVSVSKTRNGRQMCNESFRKKYAIESNDYDEKTRPFYILNILVNFDKIFIMKNYSPYFHGKIDFNFVEILGFIFPPLKDFELSTIRIYEKMSPGFWRKFHVEEKFKEKNISDVEPPKQYSDVSGLEESEPDCLDDSDDYDIDEYGLHDNQDGTWTEIGGQQLDYHDAMLLREQSDLEDGIVPDDQMGGD